MHFSNKLVSICLSLDIDFGCISQQCRLAAKFFISDENGPKLTSFLACKQHSELVLEFLEANSTSHATPVQEDSEIVGYSKLDVLSDGNEEVVICNSNGLTYILSSKPKQEIIRYHHRKGEISLLISYKVRSIIVFLSSGIRYFTCGILGKLPCFIYITSWNTLEVFSNVQLPYFNKRCILEAVEENEIIRNV